jgi:hypothetical protein
MSNAKLGLNELSPEEMVILAETIVTAMTGNANFPTPNPTLAAITTQKNTTHGKITGYKNLLDAAKAGLMQRDDETANLAALLTQLMAYVQNASGGDAAKIESAGMSVKGRSAPIGPMARVIDLLLSEGDHAGYVDAMWKPVKGAKGYEVQTCPDPISPTGWTPAQPSSKSSTTIQGLTSGAKVWVRVRALGAAGTGDWSDPALKVVP